MVQVGASKQREPGDMQVAPDRRARNRERTRRALSAAAIELFAAQGYAATTVEQIADRAGVSPRTFFRYFDAKEDVLLPLDYDMGAASAIRRQPASLTDIEALHVALVSTAPASEPAFAQIRNLRNALSASATLRGRDFDARSRAEQDLAQALAARRGLKRPDADAQAAAVIGFAVLRLAMTRWLMLPKAVPLAPLLEEEFERMQRVITAGPTSWSGEHVGSSSNRSTAATSVEDPAQAEDHRGCGVEA